jgi:metallo-beta-lactamase family protein
MSSAAPALTFLGAAGTVTGSKTLVEAPGSSALVDCGLFQGQRELRRRNWEPLPVDVTAVSTVLLTHAHLDHCGYVPRLCADGFRGRVHATTSTTELAEIVLLDSAHLLEEEARHASAHGWSRHAAPKPLYDSRDVGRALSRLVPVGFSSPVDVAPGMTATWSPAGHILGSASVLVEAGPHGPSALFSGDLGRRGHPLLNAPAAPPPADVVVVESTYGNRRHVERDPTRLADVINRTAGRGGSVLIPAFAVDRTEVLLCALEELRLAGRVPPLPVFVDSPMALRALETYREAMRRQDADVRAAPLSSGDPFSPDRWQALSTVQESMTVNRPVYPSIVISASGMASGGRVLHHLAHQLPDPRHTVVLVGFQAAGTRGRALQEGARAVKIHGSYVPVRAEVVTLDEYSSHADADEIIEWLRLMPTSPSTCYVVHGEPDAARQLRDRVSDELGWTAVVPRHGERVLWSGLTGR